MSRDWRLYAIDIRDKIAYIQNTFAKLRGIADYLSDESIQLSVERAFEINGEAAKHLPNELKEKYGYIPWKAIIGLRDQIAHGYHKIDEEIIWHTAKNELNVLKTAIEQMIRDTGEKFP